MTDRAGKLARLAHANDVIRAISRHGRRFFHSPEHDRVSRYELDGRGRLWFVDKWTGKRIYVAYKGPWRHFSEGGTLRDLVLDLACYIRTGEPVAPRRFGPWPQWYCEGDLWGYGPAMEDLRRELDASPAVDFRGTVAARVASLAAGLAVDVAGPPDRDAVDRTVLMIGALAFAGELPDREARRLIGRHERERAAAAKRAATYAAAASLAGIR